MTLSILIVGGVGLVLWGWLLWQRRTLWFDGTGKPSAYRQLAKASVIRERVK